MDNAKQQLIDRLKSANNVLVTVSRNPSVDQLAACLGLTLLLNKQSKHAAAVFSGEVPSTLEFLQPAETIEKTTDSLRDFIISIDRAKADKLRYKVEDDIVRIFITPYKTSISQEDLEFSEGDFNVDLVIALGVQRQDELDEAITAHGRILHDATVATVNLTDNGDLGTINWQDPQASSLSELVAELAQAIGGDTFDNQIATALLTGIVSETQRFSNDKTSSQTMSISAALMAAGADQQLVASKLESPDTSPLQSGEEQSGSTDGVLKIDHDNDQEPNEPIALPDITGPEEAPPPPEPSPPPEPQPAPQPPTPENPPTEVSGGTKLVTEPPTLGGTLTANSGEEKLEPAVDPLSLPASEEPQLLDHKTDGISDRQPPPGPGPAPSPVPGPAQPSAANDAAGDLADRDDLTLTQIEAAVDSPHLSENKDESVAEARDEVNQALSNSADTSLPKPIEGLNAQPLGGELHPEQSSDQPSSDQQSGEEDKPQEPPAPPPYPPPIVPGQ